MDTLQTFADLGGVGLVCPDSVPTVLGLLDPSIAPPFLYYSYLPIIVVALLFGLSVLIVSRASLAGRLFLWITILFSLITAGEMFLWIATSAAMVHFAWQIISVFHALLAFLLIYFTYAFLKGKDMPSKWQWVTLLPLLPVFIFAPTQFNLSAFDLVNCESIQGLLRPYTYAVETVALATAFFLCARASRRMQDRHEYWQAVTLGIGIVLFFGIYILSNAFGDATLLYDINLFGPLGMVAFLATIAYLIVRYRAFNMRVLGAQVLVGALAASIFAALFVRTVDTARYVLAGTLALVIVLGVLLIRSVKREVEQREDIERLARELEETNERQETLIHFIGHEVKCFLTKAEGAFAALCEGDFGELSEGLKPFVREALKQTRDGVASVSDILQASNLKKGTTTYQKQLFDLGELVIEEVERARSVAENKGLKLTLYLKESEHHPFTGDRAEIGDHVLRNLIDNAIAYTPSGAIDVTLEKKGNVYSLSVKDTGIGISAEDKAHLFTEGGHGKESQKVNVHSTGYGLYIAKKIVEAHNGTIRAESDGPGQGSTFVVELPT